MASTSAALWCSSVSLAAMAPSAAEICVLSLLSRSSAAARRAASIPMPAIPMCAAADAAAGLAPLQRVCWEGG